MALPPFQQLLNQYGVDVHRLLIASVGHGDADDCYQETWIAALRGYPKLQDDRNLKGWLLTIAHRKAIDHIRRRARVAVPVGGSHELEAAFATAAVATTATTATSRPGSAGAAEPMGDSPWTAVRQLPAKQRMAIALRYALDLEYEVIAGAMGTSTEAARRNVHEGLKKLREELDRD